MKEVKQRFEVEKGRFIDKELFIVEHPEFAQFMEPLPEEVYFQYDGKSGEISYYYDAFFQGTLSRASVSTLPLTVAQSMQDLEDLLVARRKMVKLEEKQTTHHNPITETGHFDKERYMATQQ